MSANTNPQPMLFQWWTSVWFVSYSLFGIEGVVSAACVVYTQHTRDIHPRMVQCWTGVVDGGPTLNRHLMNVSYLLDRSITSCCHLFYPPPPLAAICVWTRAEFESMPFLFFMTEILLYKPRDQRVFFNFKSPEMSS